MNHRDKEENTVEQLAPSVLFALAGVLALLLLLLRGRSPKRLPTESERYLARVRFLVAGGKYREAATLQLKQGNLHEAYNLLERGQLYSEASQLAEELGLPMQAAQQAEKAKEYLRAAALYKELGEHERYMQVLAREEDLARAAEVLQHDPRAALSRQAQHREQELLSLSNHREPPLSATLEPFQPLSQAVHSKVQPEHKSQAGPLHGFYPTHERAPTQSPRRHTSLSLSHGSQPKSRSSDPYSIPPHALHFRNEGQRLERHRKSARSPGLPYPGENQRAAAKPLHLRVPRAHKAPSAQSVPLQNNRFQVAQEALFATSPEQASPSSVSLPQVKKELNPHLSPSLDSLDSLLAVYLDEKTRRKTQGN